jgi:hypothetical protein
MWCAKVGVFCYLYRRIFLNLNEDTFAHCMEYIHRALNTFGWEMINDVATSKPSSFFGRHLLPIKQAVYDGMKTLVLLVFHLFDPPTDTPLPFWNLFITPAKGM